MVGFMHVTEKLIPNSIVLFPKANIISTAVELAQQNYDVMNARYLSQLALVTDMVDASNLKLNAELSEVDARINIVYAYYRMKYVAGEI